MTAKQRAARAKFKAVVAEAKKLRKKNPKLTQAQAVKQAFAISYSKQRSNPIKKAAKKLKEFATKAKKSFYEGYYERDKKVGAVKKKSATRVKAKKSKGTEMHTDTKSHNVNIRVMSGIKDPTGQLLGELNQTLNRISNTQIAIDKLKIGLKYKHFKKEDIAEVKRRLKVYSNYLKELKTHFRELKKQIK